MRIPWAPRDKRVFLFKFKFELLRNGHGPGPLKRGQVVMAGSTSVSGFHSRLLWQRDGIVSPLGIWGVNYASCRHCKIRKRVMNHEFVFTYFSEDEARNVRFARARAVDSLETASPGMELFPSCWV